MVGGKVNRDSKQKPSGIVMKVKVTIYEDVWKIIPWSRKLEDRLLKRMNAMNCWIELYPIKIHMGDFNGHVEIEAGCFNEVYCKKLVSWMIGALDWLTV